MTASAPLTDKPRGCPLRRLLPGAWGGRRSPTAAGARTGFTLVELLVVIAVIALLITLLFPALGICRRLAKQSREAASGAQLMAGYSVYSNDNRGSVIPGYTTDAMVSGPAGAPGTIVVTDERGNRLTQLTARRYPWRLAPTLDYNFRGLYDDPKIYEAYQNQTQREYVVSISPSFGLNADFCGGNGDTGTAHGFNSNALRIWGPFYITKLDQVRRPDRLLVFASARGVDATTGASEANNGVVPGFHIVKSPYYQASRWDAAGYTEESDPLAYGYVHPRHSGKANIVHADGHVSVMGVDELRDMTRWANQATRAAWTLGSN